MELALSDMKTYYKPSIIKTAWHCHMNRKTYKWNRIESPEIHPSRYENLVYDKGGISNHRN